MNIPVITMLIWFGLVATAAAQGTPTGNGSSQGASSQAQLSEIRAVVSELEGRTEKLRELNTQYRSLVEQRPQADDAQLAKWNTALERLLRRIDQAHAAVVETTQHLDQLATGPLPTSLAKDVANARNEAGAQRTAAEQALKSKPAPTSKPAKKTPATEKAPPPIPDDL